MTTTPAVPPPADPDLLPIPLPEPEVDDYICLVPDGLDDNKPALPPIDHAPALLDDKSIVFPDTVVDGLLHKGTKGVIAGGSKVGKTNVELDLATSVVTGTQFLNWQTTQGYVLVVNMEIPRAFIKERLRVMQERKNLASLDGLDIWTLRGTDAKVETLVDAIIDRAYGYDLIILDPIYKLMVGRSENSSTGVGVLCHNIERIMGQTGAAVVYTHHFTKGKQSGKKAMDRMSGSGVFARDADTIITLTEHTQEDKCYNVEMTLRNLPEQMPFVVQWQYPLMVLRPDLEPDDLDHQNDLTESQQYLLAVLKTKPMTLAEWKAAAETVSKTTFYRAFNELETMGLVKLNPQDKTWSVADGEAQTNPLG
jgi:hypothetical protein